MPIDGWRSLRLGDFVTLQRGHDLPIQLRRPGNVPILGSFGVTGTHDEAKARGPGVTVGRSGASFGVVSYCPIAYWPLNTALYVVDFHGNDERFAYYFLRSIDFSRFNSGSAQPSLNRNFIHPIPIEVPSFREQRSIAELLGSIDDKIDLNRRMNETLEAMARAIFKSWFVDFDPVRAKLEGRQPAGMDAGTSTLFPDSFQETARGHIPSGWEIRPLSDLIEVKHGFAFKGECFREEPHRDVLLTPGNFAIGGGFKDENLKYYEGSVPEEFVLEQGDLLVTMTDLSKMGDTLGYPAFVPAANDRRFLHNQRLGRIIVKSNWPACKEFLFQHLCTPRYRHHVLATASGSTVKHTSPNRIKDFELIVPCWGLLKAFEDWTKPLRNKQVRRCSKISIPH